MKRLTALLFVFLSFCAACIAKEGTYIEFKITSPNMTGDSRTYSAGGDTRSEMNMNMTSGKGFSFVTLTLAAAPGKHYTLNEQNKTYSETDVTSTPGYDEDDYEVTLLGKEKVNNYNCTHVSVRYKKSRRETEMWLSKEIQGYASYTGVKNKYLGGASFFNKLKEKGADGFVVRMLVNGDRGDKMQMDLVKAEKRDVAASVFSLAGYTKAAGPQMPGGVDVNALKNMTPEERKQYMEKMREQYKQRPGR